jgi:hypothetical protein
MWGFFLRRRRRCGKPGLQRGMLLGRPVALKCAGFEIQARLSGVAQQDVPDCPRWFPARPLFRMNKNYGVMSGVLKLYISLHR